MLTSLNKVLAPPKSPAEAAGRWEEVERSIGTTLPADYKELIETYGTGTVDEFLHILNPFAANPNLNVLKRSAELAGSFAGKGRTFFPRSNGLLPVGVTDNGDLIAWRTNGEPDSWRIVVIESRGPDAEEFEGPLAQFLALLLARKIRCGIFPSGFPSAKATFRRPTDSRRCVIVSLSFVRAPYADRVSKVKKVLGKTRSRGSYNGDEDSRWNSFQVEPQDGVAYADDVDVMYANDARQGSTLQLQFSDSDGNAVRELVAAIASAIGVKVLRVWENASGDELWPELTKSK